MAEQGFSAHRVPAHWPKGVPQRIEYPQTSLFENLAISARRFPDKPAIIYYGSTITYAGLLRQVERLAGFMSETLGVRHRDRVIVYLQNSPHYVVAYYAILRLAAVVVPVNPMCRTEELRHIAADTEASVILLGQELLEQVRPLLGNELRTGIVAAYGEALTESTDLDLPDVVQAKRLPLDLPGLHEWPAATAKGGRAPAHDAQPDDWSVLPYSSGTTGLPKGCLHTHRSVMATMYGGLIWNPASPASISLCCLPLFHATGMQASMNGPIYLGATIVMMTRWNRRLALELIQRHRVTHWRNITTMLVDLLADPDLSRFDLSSLLAVGGGGAPMPGPVSEKLKQLTGLSYIEGYGLTETIAGTHINPPARPKLQCLGMPISDVDSRVIDPDTLEERKAGEVGEIVISAPHVFLGYWNKPEDTAAAFLERDGKRYFRTGDLGYCDEEGYFFLVDRLKRMINASGFKIWPNEVEGMMYAYPGIHEVCVIASNDPHRGETVKAVIVPKPGARLAANEIESWCRERMAAYKVPRLIEIVDALPKSATGKILWRVLQEREAAAR